MNPTTQTRAVGRRRPRESFQATLACVADRIDRQPYHIAEWTDRLVYRGRRMHSGFRVRSLWVAGSYARGASTCGDLDLIADVSVESVPHPGESVIARAVTKGSPDVRLYIGTPQKNHSGMAFPEARLVWSETEPDWRTALAAIREDPAASRFARPGDVLPFRSEQLSDWTPEDNNARSGLERLVELRDNREITWTFTDATTIDQDETKWRSNAREYSAWTERFVGKKTHQALKAAIGCLQRDEPAIDWARHTQAGLDFTIDGIEVRIGRPSIDLAGLESVACAALVLIPHMTRRGPNGVWAVRRGDRHPLEMLFRDVGAWYDATPDGSPCVLIKETGSGFNAVEVELFRRRRRALEAAREWRDVADGALNVRCATAADLLRVMSKADILTIEGVSIPITTQGVWSLRQDLEVPGIALPSSQEIVQQIKGS